MCFLLSVYFLILVAFSRVECSSVVKSAYRGRFFIQLSGSFSLIHFPAVSQGFSSRLLCPVGFYYSFSFLSEEGSLYIYSKSLFCWLPVAQSSTVVLFFTVFLGRGSFGVFFLVINYE